MIDSSNIEEKDFSISLNEVIQKVSAVSLSLAAVDTSGLPPFQAAALHGYYHPDDLVGFGIILRDIRDDLETIRDTLYP